MNLNITISRRWIDGIVRFFAKVPAMICVVVVGEVLSISALIVSFTHDWIVTYGDAESHLNIAKRVLHSLTPGAAQLGGIWLPLPHVLMLPFVFFDPLWRTGLAGSIVSGICYLLSCIFIYKLAY